MDRYSTTVLFGDRLYLLARITNQGAKSHMVNYMPGVVKYVHGRRTTIFWGDLGDDLERWAAEIAEREAHLDPLDYVTQSDEEDSQEDYDGGGYVIEHQFVDGEFQEEAATIAAAAEAEEEEMGRW